MSKESDTPYKKDSYVHFQLSNLVLKFMLDTHQNPNKISEQLKQMKIDQRKKKLINLMKGEPNKEFRI